MNRVSFEELRAIEKTMDTYAQGTLTAGAKGVETMKKAMHEDAIMWGWYKDGRLAKGHIQGLYDVLLPAAPVKDHKMRLDILDVADSIAFVRVELAKIWENETKVFTDYHELIKIDGQWKIIGKVFAQQKDTPMQRVSFEELKAIEDTMATYAQGTLTAGEKGVEIMKKAMHEDAIMWGWYKDGRLAKGHIQGLYDVLLPAAPVTDHKMRLDILDVADSVAAVRVELAKIWPNETKIFTDYHELIKIDGQWKIIGKVFAQYKN